MPPEHIWGIILAAGEGRRLAALTTDESGTAIPKQFCSMRGHSTLLEDAIARAERVVPLERICPVVALQHRRWWQDLLLPHDNIIVQPRNRGTANGILLPLLSIALRDPDAAVVIYPSDHHVGNEAALAAVIGRVVAQLNAVSREIVLLGISPEEADPDLGYIVPSAPCAEGWLHVARFEEKPSGDRAQQMIEQGSLWNSFIMVATAAGLLQLFIDRFPDIVDRMTRALKASGVPAQTDSVIAALYDAIPNLDFSRHLLDAGNPAIRVMPVADCEWCDLGTPRRLDATLRRLRSTPQSMRRSPRPCLLNLHDQWTRLEGLVQGIAA